MNQAQSPGNGMDRGSAETTSAAASSSPIIPRAADERALQKRLEAGETVVINLRKDAHRNLALWSARQGLLIYIGRPGWALAGFNHYLAAHDVSRVTADRWANPFVVGRDGDRDTVLAKYADNRSELQTRAGELRGKALGCWCAPEPCHGDILKRWAEGGAA